MIYIMIYIHGQIPKRSGKIAIAIENSKKIGKIPGKLEKLPLLLKIPKKLEKLQSLNSSFI